MLILFIQIENKKNYFASAFSITCSNASYGCAPLTASPFMNDIGVPVTPAACPSAMSFFTSASFSPESRHLLNLSASSSSSFAYFFRSSMLNAFWFSNSLSWYSQNFPWSCAHSDASDAFCALLWNGSGKSLNTILTLPSFTYFSSIFFIDSSTLAQYGHW